nr:unnamed protein product [Spirometra erinaceieuropaei]
MAAMAAFLLPQLVADCISPPGGFNSAKMVFTPNPPHVGVTTTVQCAPGYYPTNTSSSAQYRGSTPVIDPSLARGTYKCTGSRSSNHSRDPAYFRTQFIYSGIPLQDCDEAFCQLDILSLCNARPESVSPQNQTRFKYGQQVFFDCETGYASSDNNTLSRTSMTCRTVSTQPQSGVWIPGPCQACVVTRCNQTAMLEMVPQFGQLKGARSKLTEERYGMLQVSQFNRFGNVVTFKCDEGYFFKDRTFQKFIECTLIEGTTDQSTWAGYSGTLLPIPESCTPVTCMYEDVLMRIEDKFKPNFTITFANGTQYTTNKLQPREYPYETVIRYVCQEGFETVTKDPDQNITCGALGKWLPQLTSCLGEFKEVRRYFVRNAR